MGGRGWRVRSERVQADRLLERLARRAAEGWRVERVRAIRDGDGTCSSYDVLYDGGEAILALRRATGCVLEV